MSASLNSGAGPGAGVQSTPTQPPPVSGQGSGSGSKKRSTRSRKNTETYSLTTRQQTPKVKKTKARSARGVKTSDAKGPKSGSDSGVGRGEKLVEILSAIKPKPETVDLPGSSDSSEAEEGEEVHTQPPSHSRKEDKPDQPVLSPVISPQGTTASGDVTNPVVDTPSVAKDPSFVSEDAPQSSSTPVQERTAAESVTVDVEVHRVPDSEPEEGDVSGDPSVALAHAVTGSTLPEREDPFQLPTRDVMENPERVLTLDPTRPLATLVGRVRAHLSPVRGYAHGGERVPALRSDDLAALKGYIRRVVWVNIPLLQPQQVDPPGMQCLVRALQGTVIRLVEPEDDGSATSIAETIDARLPPNRSVQDPLGLNQGDSGLEEGECKPSPHEVMDQDDVLEHNARLDERSASEAGMAYGQTTNSQSEAMDVAGAGSEFEGFSDRPMDAQDARHDRDRHESTWDEGESETAKRRRKYPKERPYTVPVHQEINNGWYQWEDLLDPSEVAPSARRMGLPNVDGSIGGDTRYALPPPRESRSNFYHDRELHRRVTYDRATKNDKGHYPHITEEERVAHAERQNTALQRDVYWENELRASHYFPVVDDSPVNYSYRVRSTTYAVPYHVMGPLTC